MFTAINKENRTNHEWRRRYAFIRFRASHQLATTLSFGKMKYLREKFFWPLWILPIVILLPLLLMPVVSSSMQFIYDRLLICGYSLITLRYLWSWRRGGERIDWIIYVLLMLLMPILVTHIAHLGRLFVINE